jgi:hypothetical protein
MEVMLSQYQAVVLNRAIQIFGTRKIGRTTLIDDAYVLQKQLAEWISVNTPKTGNSALASAVTTAARLAFNKAINDNGSSTPPPDNFGDATDDTTDDTSDDTSDDIVIGGGLGMLGGGDGAFGPTDSTGGDGTTSSDAPDSDSNFG